MKGVQKGLARPVKMASSRPLLSDSDSAQNLPSLDDMIEQYIGNFGWAQVFQSFLLSMAWFFDAQQTFITIFSDKQPSWHCTDQLTCNSESNLCNLSNTSWAWDYPIYTSTVSEWNRQCSNSIIAGLPSSVYFMGCVFGGLFLTTMADTSLGRKKLLLLSCFAMSIALLLTVLSTNIWVYAVLRFITGCGRSSVGGCALVLVSAIIGKRYRGQVGTISFLWFTLGFLSLPGIAYLNRGHSWRTLYLFTSIPGILFCVPVYMFVCESPRWLLMQGREEEAVGTLKKMATSNCGEKELSFAKRKTEMERIDFFSVTKMLLQKRWAAQRLLAAMVLLE
ncbi:unnamed protein product [Ilex paraguariensis]|uniref:Major facilitator superfamily (MFS) profile domain-containing protein n=1 Tax=Ilex paraguariensis TaxID=185542 RepID=A0ABC8QM79_9AQUA